MDIVPGMRLGSYQILAPIGAGGMGEVHRARDTKLGREVAIKVLPRHFAQDAERLARFEREARLLAALNHPRIAAIYGLEHVDGVRFLVLELAAGQTLAARLARGPLPLLAAIDVARQLVDGLDAAHEKGIVHRDLKPGNVQLGPDGQVKILDFGLAKASVADPASADSSQSPTQTSGGTRQGVALGTAAYMSPEQARGQAVDKRTDVWAFGCVLYECLTGARAFPGFTVADSITAVLEREPDWQALPAGTPAPIRRLLRRCLRKDPRDRLRDVADARVDLEDDAPAAPGTLVTRPPGLPRVPLAAGALATLALVAGGGWWLGSREPASDAPRTRLTRLTWDGGVATDPALSPDGTLLAFASNRGGESHLDLWVQRVAGGAPIRLTSDPADDDEPSYSPDGATLAFRSNRDGGGIYVMPALGGDARLLAKGGHDPRFSPDGASLAYWTGPWMGGPGLLGTAVFVVPAKGGEPRPVAAQLAAARNPVFAPDGKSLVLFGRGAGANGPEGPDWWWAPLDGRPPVPTGAFRAFDSAGINTEDLTTIKGDMLPFAWTADGVWVGAEVDESVKVFRLAISPRTGAVDGPPVRVTSGPGHHAAPAVDRAGRVAFRASLNTAVIGALPLDPNAGRTTGAAVQLASDAGERPHRGSVDPNGRVLAYPKHRPTESELWVKDLGTGRERHLVTTAPSQLNPIVAPDASVVAYTAAERQQQTGWVVEADGGVPRKICEGCVIRAWLPDAGRLLVSSPYPNTAAARALRLDGGDAGPVLPPETVTGRMDPSPDGRWLAFTTPGRRIWIAPLRPGRPPEKDEWRAVDVSVSRPAGTVAIGAERPVGWSPDGRLLYVLLEPDGFRCLHALRVDPARGVQTGQPFAVHHFHDPERQLGSTPFGGGIVKNAFVFDEIETTASIWLLDPSPGPD
jgi:serine/threonine protein kinase